MWENNLILYSVSVFKQELCIIWDTIYTFSSAAYPLKSPISFFFYPDNLSLEDIQSLLHSALLTLQHFPSPSIYTTLCALLALTMGQQDPITTAMLHSQSLGVTSRHRTIRHLASSLR